MVSIKMGIYAAVYWYVNGNDICGECGCDRSTERLMWKWYVKMMKSSCASAWVYEWVSETKREKEPTLVKRYARFCSKWLSVFTLVFGVLKLIQNLYEFNQTNIDSCAMHNTYARTRTIKTWSGCLIVNPCFTNKMNYGTFMANRITTNYRLGITGLLSRIECASVRQSFAYNIDIVVIAGILIGFALWGVKWFWNDSHYFAITLLVYEHVIFGRVLIILILL